MRQLTLFLLCCTASAQMVMTGGHRKIFSSPAPTPAFVSETSKNSTLTNAVTSLVASTTTCGAYTACYPLPDGSLSGNLIVALFQYNHAGSAVTETAADDKSDTYTCGSAASQVQIGSGYWVNYCYAANVAAGAHTVKISFGSTAVTQFTGKVQQFTNIALTSPLDGTPANCAGASSTTANCGTVTTTAANDLIDVYVARIATPSTTSFTAGSTYTLGTTDIHDGGATEFGVAASSGSVTPSMTMATATTYGEIVLPFKAAAAGTAPTGWYLRRMMSYDAATSGAIAYQFPSSGNLLIETSSCSNLTPGAITGDGTNTWTGNTSVSAQNNFNEKWVINAATDPIGTMTLNSTGAGGDCTEFFYDYAGAPNALSTARSAYYTSTGSTSPIVYYPYFLSAAGQVAFYSSSPTSGIAVMSGSQATNTSTSMTLTGAAAAYFDAAYVGGENLDGPYPLDQNNCYGHAYFNGSVKPWSCGLTDTGAVTGYGADTLSFYNSGAAIVYSATSQGSGTSMTFTIAAPTAGNLVAVNVGVYPSNAVSKVCLGGNSTCSTGTLLTQCASCASTGSGHGSTSIWYTLSAPSGSPTTVTVVPSVSVSNIEAEEYEIQKASGTWAIDVQNQTSNGTGSGSTLTGPSVTTTATTGEFCSSNVSVSGSVTASPSSSNEFQYGGTIFGNTNDGVAALMTTTATVHSAQFTDSSSNDSFSGSIACFK